MHKHLVHITLIFMLAISPLQTVLAGLAAYEHVSKCNMGSMTENMHAGMDHAGMDSDHGKKGGQCDCCGDCLVMCTTAANLSLPHSAPELAVLAAETTGTSRYKVAANSQYPPTDIRPPIVLH